MDEEQNKNIQSQSQARWQHQSQKISQTQSSQQKIHNDEIINVGDEDANVVASEAAVNDADSFSPLSSSSLPPPPVPAVRKRHMIGSAVSTQSNQFRSPHDTDIDDVDSKKSDVHLASGGDFSDSCAATAAPPSSTISSQEKLLDDDDSHMLGATMKQTIKKTFTKTETKTETRTSSIEYIVKDYDELRYRDDLDDTSSIKKEKQHEKFIKESEFVEKENENDTFCDREEIVIPIMSGDDNDDDDNDNDDKKLPFQKIRLRSTPLKAVIYETHTANPFNVTLKATTKILTTPLSSQDNMNDEISHESRDMRPFNVTLRTTPQTVAVNKQRYYSRRPATATISTLSPATETTIDSGDNASAFNVTLRNVNKQQSQQQQQNHKQQLEQDQKPKRKNMKTSRISIQLNDDSHKVILSDDDNDVDKSMSSMTTTDMETPALVSVVTPSINSTDITTDKNLDNNVQKQLQYQYQQQLKQKQQQSNNGNVLKKVNEQIEFVVREPRQSKSIITTTMTTPSSSSSSSSSSLLSSSTWNKKQLRHNTVTNLSPIESHNASNTKIHVTDGKLSFKKNLKIKEKNIYKKEEAHVKKNLKINTKCKQIVENDENITDDSDTEGISPNNVIIVPISDTDDNHYYDFDIFPSVTFVSCCTRNNLEDSRSQHHHHHYPQQQQEEEEEDDEEEQYQQQQSIVSCNDSHNIEYHHMDRIASPLQVVRSNSQYDNHIREKRGKSNLKM